MRMRGSSGLLMVDMYILLTMALRNRVLMCNMFNLITYIVFSAFADKIHSKMGEGTFIEQTSNPLLTMVSLFTF